MEYNKIKIHKKQQIRELYVEIAQLILNASSKPTCLLSFKTKFFEDCVSKLN